MGTLQSLIYVVVMEDFYSTFLNKRKIPVWKYILVWFTYLLYQEIVMVKVSTSVGNIFFNFIFVCFILHVLYTGNMKMKLVANFLGLSLSGLSEVIIAILVITIKGEVNLDNRFYAILSKIVFWIIVRIASSFIKSKMEETRKTSYLFSLGALAILNIVWGGMIFEIDSQMDDTIIHGWTLALAVALLALDIIGFKIYGMLWERYEMKKANDKYKYQLEMCNREMEERQIVMNDVRRTRHDIKNQLLYLCDLVKKNPQKAEIYLEKLMDEHLYKEKEVANCGNLVIDSLINHKFMVAAEKQIEMKLKIEVPSELPYEAADLCIIIGNLLDNAIEAAIKLEEKKWIDICIRYRQEKLLIIIKNEYSGIVFQDSDDNYISNKGNSKNHGWGLKSVKKCVEKYNGIIQINHEDKIFQVEIMM